MTQDLPTLSTFGRRIVIMGPTNAGKSTLAVALGRTLDVPAIHLDQFRHLPNTNWKVRSNQEFARLHDEAILGPGWVMEGNYSDLTPQRLARATGVMVLTDWLPRRYWRYFFRTLFQKRREGALDGGEDRINRMMLGWLWKTRHSAGKYQQIALNSRLPHLFANDQRDLQTLYRAWGLTLPSA